MNRCECLTKSGTQCSLNAQVGSKFCKQHEKCQAIIGELPLQKHEPELTPLILVRQPNKSEETVKSMSEGKPVQKKKINKEKMSVKDIVEMGPSDQSVIIDLKTKYNLANFRKVFKLYDQVMFRSKLSQLIRDHGYGMSNWHFTSQVFGTLGKYPALMIDKVILYQIGENHILLSEFPSKIYKMLKVSTEAEVLNYVVEEFILDYMCVASYDGSKDLSFLKQKYNDLFFQHEIILPTIFLDEVLGAYIEVNPSKERIKYLESHYGKKIYDFCPSKIGIAS